MANAVGNIYIGLHVDTSRTRAFSTAAGIIGRDASNIRRSLGDTSRSVTALRSNMSQGLRSRMLSDMVRQASQANNEVGKLRATMLGLAALTGTSVTGAFAGTFLLQTADSSNRLNNQLRTVTKSENDLIATRQRLHAISQITRSDMQATVTLYARNTRAAQEFGVTQEQMLRATETIQKAFAIGGASQQEAMGAAVQLSQGIASDRFSGDEYRSVSENAPVLLQQMARHLDVGIGKLREMAHAGELTGKVVIDAILGASAAIDKDFNKTVPTAGQALTRLNNAFLQSIGNIDSEYGATRRLSEGLSNLAENFQEVAHWGLIAAGAGASIFLARGAAKSSGTLWSALIPSAAEKRAVQESLSEIRKQRSEIQKEIAAIRASPSRAVSPIGIGPVRPSSYGQDVASLQSSQAMVRALQEQGRAEASLSKAMKAKVVDIDKVASAQDRVERATIRLSNIEKAAGDTAKRVTAERAATASRLVELRNRDIILTKEATAATTRLTLANRALGVAQRVGASVLGFMGGPVGVAFLAGIAGMMAMGDAALKTQERTAKLRKELHDLGLISDEVAGVTEKTVDSIEALGASAIRNKLREIADEIARMKGTQNIFEQLFAYDPQVLGNMLTQLDRVRNGFTPDARGINTFSAEEKRSAEMFREIVIAARDGTSSVEVLQSKLDILSKNNPEMMPWLDKLVEGLRGALPLMDGLQTRAEMLQSQLRTMNSNGISTGWIEGLIAQKEAMEAAQRGSKFIQQYADEQIRVLRLTEEQSRIEEMVNAIRKEGKDIAEDGAKLEGFELEQAAKRIIAAEDAAAAEKKRTDEQKKSAEALREYLQTLRQMEADVARLNASANEGDRAAGRSIQVLIEKFKIGRIDATELHLELGKIGRANVSGGVQDLISKLQGAIPLAANLLNFVSRLSGFSVGSLDSDALFGDFAAGEIASSKMTSDEKYRDALITRYQGTDIGGGLKPTLEQATQLADAIIANEKAISAAAESAKAGAKASDEYRQGMADLNRELAAAPLEPFLKEVLAAAAGMGLSTQELDDFIAAATSGGLDAAPTKFRDIANALRSIKEVEILENIRDEIAQLQMASGDFEIFKTLRDAGIEADSAVGRAVTSTYRLLAIFKEARGEVKSFVSDFISGFKDRLLKIDDEHAASRLKNISDLLAKAQENGKEIAIEQRKAIIELAGSMADAEHGANSLERTLKAAWESLADAAIGALNRIGAKLVDSALDGLFGMLLGPLLGGLGGGFGTIGLGGVGLPTGGFVPGLTGPRLFSKGGLVSGPGTSTSDSIPARLSDGEYVVKADAARKHRRILEAINNGFDGAWGSLSASAPAGGLSVAVKDLSQSALGSDGGNVTIENNIVANDAVGGAAAAKAATDVLDGWLQSGRAHKFIHGVIGKPWRSN